MGPTEPTSILTSTSPTETTSIQASPTSTSTVPIESTSVPTSATSISTSFLFCHTAQEGEECYGHVIWAKETGIQDNPDRYTGLQPSSDFEDFQKHLFDNGLWNCQQPCPTELS